MRVEPALVRAAEVLGDDLASPAGPFLVVRLSPGSIAVAPQGAEDGRLDIFGARATWSEAAVEAEGGGEELARVGASGEQDLENAFQGEGEPSAKQVGEVAVASSESFFQIDLAEIPPPDLRLEGAAQPFGELSGLFRVVPLGCHGEDSTTRWGRRRG